MTKQSKSTHRRQVAMAEDCVRFDNPGDLLRALYAAGEGRGESFPASILSLADGGWAVGRSAFGKTGQSTAELERLLLQYAVPGRIVLGLVQGEPLPLVELLESGWTRRDPVRADSEEWFEGGRFDRREYILGAKTDEQNEQLLAALMNCRVAGIEARGINKADPAGPYVYLWHVSGGRPPAAVLSMAAGVWWGPVARRSGDVYEQWPYTTSLPEEWLNAAPWGAPLVLLGRDAPEKVLVQVGDRRLFGPLYEAVELHPEARKAVVVLQGVDPGPEPLDLDVELKLIPDTTRDVRRRREDEIVGEISYLQAVLESMTPGGRDPGDDPFPVREPLYLYREAGSRVPFALRRLLVEWSDLPEDLRSLQYTRIAEPSGGGRGVVHVLTTKSALGKDRDHSSGVGLRLRAYAPDGAEPYPTRFVLAPEWVRFGLRLFIPAGRNLVLYPELKPSRLAAEKLFHALSPEPARFPSGDCFLLLPADDDSFTSLRIPGESFQPLIEAYRWECRANVQAKTRETLMDSFGALQERFLEGVHKSFKKTLSARLATLEEEQNARLAELARAADEWVKMEALLRQSQPELQGVLLTIQGIRDKLSALVAQFGALSTAVGRIETLQKDLAKYDQQLNEIVAECEQIRLSLLPSPSAAGGGPT